VFHKRSGLVIITINRVTIQDPSTLQYTPPPVTIHRSPSTGRPSPPPPPFRPPPRHPLARGQQTTGSTSTRAGTLKSPLRPARIWRTPPPRPPLIHPSIRPPHSSITSTDHHHQTPQAAASSSSSSSSSTQQKFTYKIHPFHLPRCFVTPVVVVALRIIGSAPTAAAAASHSQYCFLAGYTCFLLLLLLLLLLLSVGLARLGGSSGFRGKELSGRIWW
jgi:hypothetical protein